MGQESLTCFDQPKKKENQKKTKTTGKMLLLQIIKNSNNNSSAPTEKKPTVRKPIIITKMRLKIAFYSSDMILFIHVIKKEFLTSINCRKRLA
jgi:hypothetical protein